MGHITRFDRKNKLLKNKILYKDATPLQIIIISSLTYESSVIIFSILNFF